MPMDAELCAREGDSKALQLTFDFTASVAFIDNQTNFGPHRFHRPHHFEIGALLAEKMGAAEQGENTNAAERRGGSRVTHQEECSARLLMAPIVPATAVSRL